MSKNKLEKISFPMIFIFSLLMMTFVYVQVEVFDHFSTKDLDKKETQKEVKEWRKIDDIKAAKQMYQYLDRPMHDNNFIDKTARQRTLESFYELRAYDGAPPVIPHPVEASLTLTGDSCLACHENGGFVPKFNAYAPVVPHPEKKSCRQCHNPRDGKRLFKNTNWKKNSNPRGVNHLPGSPLTIPHSIQMRENCLSCHSGPAAVLEIRTTHPERTNCLQCHVEIKSKKIWGEN